MGVKVAAAVTVSDGVGVLVGVAVGVSDGVAVTVAVGVPDGVGLCVAVGVAVERAQSRVTVYDPPLPTASTKSQ